MSFKKWICLLPLIALTLIGCAVTLDLQTTQVSTPELSGTYSVTASPIKEISVQPIDVATSTPSWYAHPPTDPALLGKEYGLLETPQAHIYNSLEDVVKPNANYWLAPAPPAYLAYDRVEDVAGVAYVHLTDGGWIKKSLLRSVEVTRFSGLVLSSVPSHIIGWVLHDVTGWLDSTATQSSGKFHPRYEPVSISTVIKEYAEVGQGDWLALSDLALVDLGRIELPFPDSCRWVDVNLASQTLVVFDGCQPVFATLISSARPPATTPTGIYTIFYKEEKLPLFANERLAVSENFYLADVPWLMFFHESWAIHGTYWHDHFGEPWSHGCINVSPYDARWLFNWSKLGDIISVHE